MVMIRANSRRICQLAQSGMVNLQIPENGFANELTCLPSGLDPLFASEESEDGEH